MWNGKFKFLWSDRTVDFTLQIYTPDNSVTQQNADKFKQFSNNFKELFFKQGFLCRSRRGSLNPRT